MSPKDYFNNAFVRKPSYWDDCNSVAVARCPQEVRAWLINLPVHRLPDGYTPIRDFPTTHAIKAKEFIAFVGGSQFLVDTQGYAHCRYAVRLTAV